MASSTVTEPPAVLSKPTVSSVQPDENRHVFVYHTVIVSAGTNENHHSWSVWLGKKKETDIDNQPSALRYARQVADVNGRVPGWLVDGPNPPAAIDWTAIRPA